jgi:4-amino-4-deoxy-L-arabinose transferase-like glycosyltransferase
MTRLLDLLTQRWSLALMAVGVLALSLRLLALWSLSTTPYFHGPIIDEALYHQWALQLVGGTYTSTAVYLFAPLPAYVMAAIYKILSPDIFYIRLLNIALGSGTCVMIAFLGRALANRVVGLLAGVAAALYAPFILYSIVPLKTALAVFLFAASISVFVALVQKPSRAMALLLGLAVGLTTTVRENVLALVPVMAAMVLWSGYREGASVRRLGLVLAILLTGLAMALGPFLARNYLVAGEVALTSSQAGFNLYLGNNPSNPDPYYRPASFALSLPYEQQVQFRIEASRRAGRPLSPAESSRFWIAEVARTAATAPGAFLWKLWQKTLAVFNRFEACDHYDITYLSRSAAIFKFPFLTFAVIFPFGIAGMVVSAFKSRASSFVSILFAVYAATLVIFFTNGRYRLPLLVILIPFAMIGLEAFFLSWRERGVRQIATCSAVVALALAVECLPVRGTDDLSGYYNIHAMLLSRTGLEQEALTYWEASSEMKKPFSAFANLSLAEKSLARKDVQKARSYLERIPDDSFAGALKHESLGDGFVMAGHPEEAVAAYRKALDINAGLLGPRRKLVRLLSKTDRERASQEYRALQEIASFYRGL